MGEPLESVIGISPRKIWTAKMAVRKLMRNTKAIKLSRPVTLRSNNICKIQLSNTKKKRTRSYLLGDRGSKIPPQPPGRIAKSEKLSTRRKVDQNYVSWEFGAR